MIIARTNRIGRRRSMPRDDLWYCQRKCEPFFKGSFWHSQAWVHWLWRLKTASRQLKEHWNSQAMAYFRETSISLFWVCGYNKLNKCNEGDLVFADEQAMCSGSRPGQSVEEITKSKASTTRHCMHRLLAWNTSGWDSVSPPSTISTSIKWTYAWHSSELTWRKRSICTCHRDTFVWSLEADTSILGQRLCGRWYSAGDSLFIA